MTLHIELTPEMETALKTEAARMGLSVEDYAQILLAGSLPIVSNDVRSSNGLSDEEFEAALDIFAEGSEHLPVLPPEANSREWIYGDHD